MAQEQTYKETDERFESILRSIIQQLYSRERRDNVAQALYCLLGREANTWLSIRLLRDHTPEEFRSVFMVDAGTLLRAMFDAYLQANLIFQEPAKRIEHATQYLDFEHVERYKWSRNTLRHDNPLANRLRSSPFRDDGEERLQQEFDRVKDQFLNTGHKWYKGNLALLAKAASKEAEYETFAASFSGCVHSSAFSVVNGPMVQEEHILFLASTFAARVAKFNVEYNQLEIGVDRLILDEFCKSWLDG